MSEKTEKNNLLKETISINNVDIKREIKINKKEEKIRLEKELKRKEKMKNILLYFGLIFIIGLVIFLIINRSDSNHIKEISYTKYEEIIKKDEYTIILLASPTCSHCFSYKPLMNQALDEYNLKAQYVNVGGLNSEQILNLHDSISTLRSQYNEEGIPIIPTPTTVLFKNGIEIDSIMGNIGYDGFVNFLKRNGVV